MLLLGTGFPEIEGAQHPAVVRACTHCPLWRARRPGARVLCLHGAGETWAARQPKRIAGGRPALLTPSQGEAVLARFQRVADASTVYCGLVSANRK